MRPLYLPLALAAFCLSACVATVTEPPPDTPAPADTPIPATSTPLPQRAPLLRIAVLGETTTTNVWALFDEAKIDYWNNATQADYWPSLYHLAPPSQRFQPATALGNPSPLECDSTTCTATVTLQPDLAWTDGSPLTADDVAFTVNTALQFRLSLNWQAAYNPDVLDHAEAVNKSTVKYYFKTRPTVADWQYGALQGPIVNQAYWSPRIVNAVNLLPDETLLPAILELEDELAAMQADVEKLHLSLNTMAPASEVYQDTSRQAQNLQEELNSIYNKLEKNRTEYETKLAEARDSLFELANANEPTLGPWKFASRIEDHFENQVNFDSPFGAPRFDSVRYITYSGESTAVRALINDEVDLILIPEGLPPSAVSHLEDNPEISLARNLTRSARFLVFNHANPFLADPALHQALACMLDPQLLVERLGSAAAPLPGFVLDDFWRDKESSVPCSGATEEQRLVQAVNLLKKAGYSWRTEPVQDVDGSGLETPEGDEIPRLSLLTPQDDPMRDIAAKYIAQQAEILGLGLDVQIRNPDNLFYEVYGSRGYDLALLGWRLSAYPSYLCEWFAPSEQNLFAYSGSNLKSVCDAWSQVTELEMAQTYAFEAQSVLMQDLPLIPLYVHVQYDAYRNIRYPFSNVIGGLTGLYGAPALAEPIP